MVKIISFSKKTRSIKTLLIKALFILLFITLSFGQLERITLIAPFVHIYLHEVIMAVIIACAAGRLLRISVTRNMRIIMVPILLFLSAVLISYIASAFDYTFLQNKIALAYIVRLSLYFGFFWIILGVDAWGKQLLSFTVLIYFLLTIAFSFLQLILYPNLRNLAYLGWDPHLNRAFGMLFDTSTAGGIYLLMFLWMQGIRQKTTRYIGQMASGSLLLLSFSRANYLGFLTGFLYVLGRKRLLLFIIVACTFAIAAYSYPKPRGFGGQILRTFTIQARIKNYQEAIELFSQHPIFGVGYNRIAFTRTKDWGHAASAFSSSYATILVSSGIIGFITFLYLIGSLFLISKKRARSMIVALSIASIFDNIMLVNIVMLIMFYTIAQDT